MNIERPMFPPVASSRRRFLSQAAGVAAGGTALAMVATSSQPAVAARPAAAASPDPVFALIAERWRASAAHTAACMQADDESWEEDDRIIGAACSVENDATDALVTAEPTSLSGITAWVEELARLAGSSEGWLLDEERLKMFLPALAAALRKVVLS